MPSELRFKRAGRGVCRILDTPYYLLLSPEMSEGPQGGKYSIWELAVETERGNEATNEPGWRTLREAKAYLKAHPELLSKSEAVVAHG